MTTEDQTTVAAEPEATTTETALVPAETATAEPETMQIRQSEFEGNVKRVLEPARPAEVVRTYGTTHDVLVRASASPVVQRLASFVQRPLTEWGLLAEGDDIVGHMDLLDLNTGEKVQALPGHKVGKDGLYANLKNFPQYLGVGDTIAKILAAH